jgi:hypothetical protein
MLPAVTWLSAGVQHQPLRQGLYTETLESLLLHEDILLLFMDLARRGPPNQIIDQITARSSSDDKNHTFV